MSDLLKVTSLIDKALVANIILVGVLTIIVLVLRKINIGSCILGSGLILFLIKLFVYERIDSENILIVSDHFSLIVRSMFKYISEYMIYISVILICIGFILCLFKIHKKWLKKSTQISII